MIIKPYLNKIKTKVVDIFIIPFLRSEKANLLQCSSNGLWDDYFINAEKSFQMQWDSIIWPAIKNFNFNSVLELAPGAGRNTEKLCQISNKIFVVEYNNYSLEKCKERINNRQMNCKIKYFLNDGSSLGMIKKNSISTIYCWDAAVHFDKNILKNYIKEFSRVLIKNGNGFVHHANLKGKISKNIKKNPGWRSNVSKKFVAEVCKTNRLNVIMQIDLPWNDFHDCITIFKK